MSGHLFSRISIFDVEQGQRVEAKRKIQQLDGNYVLGVSEEDLVCSLVDEIKLDPPVLNEAGIQAEFEEADIDVSHDPTRYIIDRSRPFMMKGTQMTFCIPFAGDGAFFEVRPQMFSAPVWPETEIRRGELRWIFRRLDHNGEAVKNEFNRALAYLKQNLASLKTSADNFNAAINNEIRQQVAQRKQKLLADAHMAANLGVPIRKREGVPTTYAVPMQQRQPRIERPRPPAEKFQPEPVLSMDEYENILSIVQNMVHVMERSPKAFEGMGEEDLRMHFLVQLNGQYEGRATGETFNYQGKTDILIREENRNVFIAECKFWKGEKQFLETIDQLLSYVSWRDTKTAVLIFNRNANFSEVLARIQEAVPKHKCYKRTLGNIGESNFRFVFHQPADPNREVIVSVLAFDVPTKEHREEVA